MGGQRSDVREVRGVSFIINVSTNSAISVVNTGMDFCLCKCVVVEAELVFIFMHI